MKNLLASNTNLDLEDVNCNGDNVMASNLNHIDFIFILKSIKTKFKTIPQS
jgi:hypothetical protein